MSIGVFWIFATVACVHGQGSFSEPSVVTVQDGDLIVLEAQPFKFVSQPNGLVDFTTRAWCYNGVCSVPGPTLLVHPGTTITIQVKNSIPSSQPTFNPTLENTLHSPDTVNIHTHGMHVSPDEDDVLTSVLPGASRNYTYTIPEDHYEGTLWYHTHYHGSTLMGVAGGMAGFLLMQRAGNVQGTTDWDAMTANVLLIQEFELKADCLTNADGLVGGPAFAVASLCYLYHNTNYQNPSVPWDATGTSATLLVNGLEQPTLDIAPGEWRRLRLLNAGGTYWLMIRVETGCAMQLMGWDGVFFQGGPRVETFVVLNPAKRADIAVMCDTAGTYALQHASNGLGTGGVWFPVDPFTLVTLNVGGTAVSMPLPSTLTPPSPFPAYMADTRGLTLATEQTWAMGGPTGGINGILFDHSFQFTFTVDGNAHQWQITGGAHPYHQHVHHYQLQADIVSAGVTVALEGDWVDNSAGAVTIRFWALSFPGTLVLHCHFLLHEDLGMMALVLMESPPSVSPTGSPVVAPPSTPTTTGSPTLTPTANPTASSSSVDYDLTVTTCPPGGAATNNAVTFEIQDSSGANIASVTAVPPASGQSTTLTVNANEGTVAQVVVTNGGSNGFRCCGLALDYGSTSLDFGLGVPGPSSQLIGTNCRRGVCVPSQTFTVPGGAVDAQEERVLARGHIYSRLLDGVFETNRLSWLVMGAAGIIYLMAVAIFVFVRCNGCSSCGKRQNEDADVGDGDALRQLELDVFE